LYPTDQQRKEDIYNIVSFIGLFLQKRPVILSILLTLATPYLVSDRQGKKERMKERKKERKKERHIHT